MALPLVVVESEKARSELASVKETDCESVAVRSAKGCQW